MYQHFDPEKFGHEKAQAQAVEFGPSAERHSLALIGPARQGKSRLMWKVVQQFFDDLQNLEGNQDWVDQIYFEELMVDFQRSAIDRVAQSRYCFIDNIGCVDSYGRERAQLQSAIRTRVRDNRWTFLTIDNLQNFDPGLADILKSRAKVIYIE
jgi:predicted AAA+ superfamily ATPase